MDQEYYEETNIIYRDGSNSTYHDSNITNDGYYLDIDYD